MSDPAKEENQDKPIRDSKGRFPKGVSGNPTGRPLGARSLTAMLRHRIEEYPERAQEMLDNLINMARAGDLRAVEIIMDRLEGKALQQMDTEVRITHGYRDPVVEAVDLAAEDAALAAVVPVSETPGDSNGSSNGKNGAGH